MNEAQKIIYNLTIENSKQRIHVPYMGPKKGERMILKPDVVMVRNKKEWDIAQEILNSKPSDKIWKQFAKIFNRILFKK